MIITFCNVVGRIGRKQTKLQEFIVFIIIIKYTNKVRRDVTSAYSSDLISTALPSFSHLLGIPTQQACIRFLFFLRHTLDYSKRMSNILPAYSVAETIILKTPLGPTLGAIM